MFECAGCGVEIPYSSAFEPPGWQGFEVFCGVACCQAFLEGRHAEGAAMVRDIKEGDLHTAFDLDQKRIRVALPPEPSTVSE